MGCLFNIKEDPCEYTDLANTYPDVTAYMTERLNFYNNHQLLLVSQEDAFTCVAVSEGKEYWAPFQTYDEAIVSFETRLYTDWIVKYEDIQTGNYDKHDVNKWKEILNSYDLTTTKTVNNDKNTNNKTKNGGILFLEILIVIILIGMCIGTICYCKMCKNMDDNYKDKETTYDVNERTPLINDKKVNVSDIQ